MDRMEARGLQGPEIPGPSSVLQRHPLSERFHEILKEVGATHDAKQQDYGVPGDPFHNVRSSEAFGVPAWKGAIMRAHDKMVRIQAYCRTGHLKNEGVRDSLIDLAVYAIIAEVLREEAEGKLTG